MYFTELEGVLLLDHKFDGSHHRDGYFFIVKLLSDLQDALEPASVRHEFSHNLSLSQGLHEDFHGDLERLVNISVIVLKVVHLTGHRLLHQDPGNISHAAHLQEHFHVVVVDQDVLQNAQLKRILLVVDGHIDVLASRLLYLDFVAAQVHQDGLYTRCRVAC